MLIVIGSRSMKRVVAEAIEDAEKLTGTASTLRKKLCEMEIEQAKKQEGWDRREREVEHKVGLERKRQEFEIDAAAKGATLEVREENLKADKERFKAEMEFQRERLQEEVTSLREMVAEMLKRLPSAEIFHDTSGRKK